MGARFPEGRPDCGRSCFPKDVKAFYAINQQVGATFDLRKEVGRVKERQQKMFLNRVCSTLQTARRVS